MRRNRLLLFAALLLTAVACSPDESDTLAPDEVFVKYYGGAGTDRAADLVVNTQGLEVDSYVIFGSSDSYTLTNQTANREWVLIFSDKGGNMQTDGLKRFPITDFMPPTWAVGEPVDCIPSRIKKTSDGGYILIGTLEYVARVGGDNVEQTDMLVIKVDQNGDYNPETDVQVIGAFKTRPSAVTGALDTLISNQRGADVVEISEGFLCVGTTEDVNLRGQDPNAPLFTNFSDFLIVKLNSQMDTVWTKPEGGLTEDNAVAVEAINNGNDVLIAGRTKTSRSFDVAIAEIPTLGTATPASTSFTVVGDETFDETVVKMVRQADNDIYLAGNSSVVGGGPSRPFVMRVISTELLFNERIAVPDGVFITDFKQTLGGRFLFAGTTSPLDDGGAHGSQLLLMRTDAFGGVQPAFDGDLYSGRRYGGSGNDFGRAVAQLPDGKFVMLGTMGLDGNAFTVMGLIKTNANGLVGK